MRVKTTEKIIIIWKESELWNDFDRFIGVIRSEITVEEIEGKLLGNTCGRRPTSCTDQLAKAVRTAYNEISQSA